MDKAMDRRAFVRGAAMGTAVAAGAAVAGTALAAGASGAAASSKDAGAAASAAGDGIVATKGAPAWLGEEPQIGASDIAETKDTTLLIIGAGTAGLACAGTAVDMGLDFILAEKLTTIAESREYIGAVNSAMQQAAGITIDEGKLLNELVRYASGKCNRDLVKVWINESADAIDWIKPMLEAAGSGMILPDYASWEEQAGGTDYYSPATEHMTSTFYIPPQRNDVILDHINAAGKDVAYEYELVRLVHEDGRVTGAIFETPDGYVQVNAKYTVLTTGGYAGNPEMMAALQPDAVAVTTADSYNPGNKGEGIKAGMWAGAAKQSEPTPMLFDRGAVDPGVDAGYEVVNGKPGFRGRCTQRNILSQPFLKVNRDGKRFANESTSYDTMCFALLNQPGGVFCQVFDGNAREDIIRFRQTGCAAVTRLYMEAGGDIDGYLEYVEDETFKKADTLEELAELLGFEGEARDAFLKTIDEYNAMYDAQQDAQYGKEAYRLSAIRTAPFYGCWAGASLLTTLDGLRINADMQVLGADLKPIEGLYAAGDCSGDFFATNYPEFIVGSAAGRTTVEGRHVAKEVAALEGIDVEKADAAAKKALAAAVTDTSGDDADYVTNGAMVAW